MEDCDMSTSTLGAGEQMTPECSMSFGALVKQSAAVLNNECLILETRIEEKARDNKELKELCARQAENIAKQQSELEHYKIKIQSEEMQIESHMAKISNLREKLQVLEKYFGKWGQTINFALGYKNELEEIIEQLKTNQSMLDVSNEQLEKENKYYIEQANSAFLGLQERKSQEKSELCELKAHFSSQLEQQTLYEKELEQELRELQTECREKEIMINILEPQRVELQQKHEKLKIELTTVNEEMASTNNQLEISLQEVSARKIQLSTDIEYLDQNINELNKVLVEKEAEINKLNSKQKLLNSEEEELIKTSKSEQQELQKLECTIHELTQQLTQNMKTEAENISLKAKYDDLQNENNDYKRMTAEVENNTEAKRKQIEDLSKYIEEMNIEIDTTIKEQLVIEDAIKKLEKEQKDNENEHKDLSLEIDKTSAELQDENNCLKLSFEEITQKLLEASETNNEMQKTRKILETELAQAKDIAKESDFKLSSFREDSNALNKVCIEEIQLLSEAMERSIEDYEKAVSDCAFYEEVKKEVYQLELDLENNSKDYAHTFQDLQDSFAIEIENKRKLMAESRSEWEREYRNKEVMKTDALVELKENKARVIELEKQIALVQKETAIKADNVRKCDNLIKKIMSKFNKVAQVAMTSSQSVVDVDPTSQQANFNSTTPKTQRKLPKVESPGSESSGKTFNPDDVDLKKISFKRPHLQPYTNFQNIPKKKTAPALPKKMADPKNTDDWGFPI